MIAIDHVLESRSAHDEIGGTARSKWELVPILIAAVESVVIIGRGATTVGGMRAYLLFDDAAISLTYARNFANGHGLVWVAGQHPVEGYSNFLWIMVMSLVELGRPSDQMAGFWIMIIGAMLVITNVYLIMRITAWFVPGNVLMTVAAGLVTATFFGLNAWTLVGMETGLVAVLSSGALLCVLKASNDSIVARRRDALLLGAGSLLALDLLARDDALILGVVVLAWILLRMDNRWRSIFTVGIPMSVAFIGHLAFRLIYYGYPFPNTYYLKVSRISLMTRVDRGSTVVLQAVFMVFLVPVVLATVYFVLRRRRGGVSRGAGLLCAAVAAQALYIVYVGGDSYDTTFLDRYLVPYLPLLFVLAVLGTAELAAPAPDRRRAMAITGAAIVIGSLLTLSNVLPVENLQQIGTQQTSDINWWGLLSLAVGLGIVLAVVLSMLDHSTGTGVVIWLTGAMVLCMNSVPVYIWNQDGTWASVFDRVLAVDGTALANSVPANATIAVRGAGNIALFDHRTSIDLLGYTDHTVASGPPHQTPTFQPGHDKWNYRYSIHKERPDIVFGLYDPTVRDIANMKHWGYLQYSSIQTGTIYYLPGEFSPLKFDTAYVRAQR